MSKILVIDDDESVWISVQCALPDYEVLCAADGIEGLDLFRQHLAEIALVVLDINMPHLDGRATCLKIRSMNQRVPIVPFTGFPREDGLNMLRELGCCAPIIKPAEPSLITQNLRQALASESPPLAPSIALLTYTQELVTEREQAGRAERARQAIIYVADPAARRGLKALCDKAGILVSIATGYMSNVREALIRVAPIALITTLADLSGIKALAAEKTIPVIVLASFTEGLTLVEMTEQAEPHLGIVIESRDNDEEVLSQISMALQTVERTHYIPNGLVHAFTAMALPPRDQEFLTLDARGLSTQEIAARLGIHVNSVPQYRMRIRQHLNIRSDQTLHDWAEDWWRARE